MNITFRWDSLNLKTLQLNCVVSFLYIRIFLVEFSIRRKLNVLGENSINLQIRISFLFFSSQLTWIIWKRKVSLYFFGCFHNFFSCRFSWIFSKQINILTENLSDFNKRRWFGHIDGIVPASMMLRQSCRTKKWRNVDTKPSLNATNKTE